MLYNQKGQENPVKGHTCGFSPPHFSEFRAFRTLHPPKRHMFLKFLVEKKRFHFSKRALLADTAHNNWLKEALADQRSTSLILSFKEL